ncbi:hypothetical protein BH10CYA1_BH10CYA1_23120 [soil metagenome]
MKNLSLVTAVFIGLVTSCPVISAAPVTAKKPTSVPAVKKTNMQYPFINGHYAMTGIMKTNGYRSNAPTVVVVDKGSHSTHIIQLQHLGRRDEIVRVMTVSNAIGTEDKPTPPGRYFVAIKKKFPVWVPTKEIDPEQKPVPPYNETHKNPLGVAALFLDRDELALHGTNDPKAIRKSASHGCVRHSNADISRIFGMVKKNTPVYIVREFRGTVLNRNDFIKSAPPKDRAVATK